MRKPLVTVFLLTNLLFALALQAGPQKAAPQLSTHENQRRSFAINLLRAINNSELDYQKKHGAYANWDALMAENYFDQSGTKYVSEDFPTVAHALYGRGPEIVPGWKLRLNVSNNGKSYDALLEDVTDPKCGYAGLTDERGVIRQSKAIDCPL
jgi:hypothetical protein